MYSDLINKVKWMQCIPLPDGTITPGVFNYGSDYITRFGLSKDLNGKTVLDVGANDGLFSFEAEKLGAKVTALDFYQNHPNSLEPNKPFQIAKEILNSNVDFCFGSLENFWKSYHTFDVTLYYGVLYHVEEPLKELKMLADLTKEYTLIETAICTSHRDSTSALWEFIPGHLGDTTNFWVPNYAGLEKILIHVGFKRVEQIYSKDNRITVRAYK